MTMSVNLAAAWRRLQSLIGGVFALRMRCHRVNSDTVRSPAVNITTTRRFDWPTLILRWRQW